jgi:hypothetical protein
MRIGLTKSTITHDPCSKIQKVKKKNQCILYAEKYIPFDIIILLKKAGFFIFCVVE